MRIALIYESKADFISLPSDFEHANSDLLSEFEEDELISGLRDAGHELVIIGDGEKFINRAPYWRKRCDLVFNRSVGYRGIDRKSFVPGALELTRIPYIGSGAYVSSLTRHKLHAKLVVASAGVHTACAVAWNGPPDTARLSELTYPAIVKPIAESCSVGIAAGESVVTAPTEAALRSHWIVDTFDQPALVETFVRGVEVEVPLVGWPKLRPLGVVGITVGGVAVHGSMYLPSDTVYSDNYGFTTSLPAIDLERVQTDAIRAANALGIRDYGRVDFRVDDSGTPMFLEATTHPHIMKHSSFFVLAKQSGASYPEMLNEIIATACRRLGLS